MGCCEPWQLKLHMKIVSRDNITLPFNKEIQLSPPSNLLPSNVLISYVKYGNGFLFSWKTPKQAQKTFLPIYCFMNIKYSPHWLWLIKTRKWKVWCALCLLPCWFSPGCSSRPLALLPFLSWLHNALSFGNASVLPTGLGFMGLAFTSEDWRKQLSCLEISFN